MSTEKKTLTVRFTANEANWLLAKLDRIVNECREKAKQAAIGVGPSPSLLREQFQAESIMDRIRSEQ